MPRVENSITNGLITSGLISQIVDSVNSLYDWAVDLGLENRTNDPTSPVGTTRGLLTRLKPGGSPTVKTWPIDKVKIFTYRESITARGKRGNIHNENVKFRTTRFTERPHVTVTIEQDPATVGLFATIAKLENDEVNVKIYNYSGQDYDIKKNFTINLIAIGIENG